MASLPAPFPEFTKDVVLQVAEFPDDDVCDDLGLETPFDILGLYQGVGLERRGVEATIH